MEYNGKYNIFYLNKVNTYPLSTRSNKVTLDDLIRVENIDNLAVNLPDKTCDEIENIAQTIVSCRRAGKKRLFEQCSQSHRRSYQAN